MAPFETFSVNGSALPRKCLALSCTASRRFLASFSSSKAPTWIIQPLCLPDAVSLGAAAGSGTVAPAEATLAGRVPRIPGRAPGGGNCGVSLLTVATSVTCCARAEAGAGARRCALGAGADSEAVRIAPGCTTTVLTALGLIGAVEPTAGASIASLRANVEPKAGEKVEFKAAET